MRVPRLGRTRREPDVPEPSRGEEGRVGLGFAFPPAGRHQHVEVGELTLRSLVGRTKLPLDDQQRRTLHHCPPAGAEDADAVLVLPVVEDRLEHVGVAPVRQRVEEAPADHLAAYSNR